MFARATVSFKKMFVGLCSIRNLNHWTSKSKVVPAPKHHTIKVHMGHEGKALSFLNLNSRPHTLAILLP